VVVGEEGGGDGGSKGGRWEQGEKCWVKVV